MFRFYFLLIIVSVATFSSCASPPYIYQPTQDYYANQEITFENAGPQIERGKPISIIDGLNHYVFSLPTKLILWDWQILDHRLPEENKAILEHYLQINKLHSVRARGQIFNLDKSGAKCFV